VKVLMQDGIAQKGVTLPAREHNKVVTLSPREHRRQRRGRVLAIIAGYGPNGATALDIGAGITGGSVEGERMGATAKERLGLKIASSLVQDRLVVPTRGNRFMLKEWQNWERKLPSPAITWDGDRRRDERQIGMVEPHALPPREKQRIVGHDPLCTLCRPEPLAVCIEQQENRAASAATPSASSRKNRTICQRSGVTFTTPPTGERTRRN
jgi:hypothetical protein